MHRPKLREEVRSMIEQPSEIATVPPGSRGKRKATTDFDSDQYALFQSQILINTNIDDYFQPRLNKRLKSFKPSGLRWGFSPSGSNASHPSGEQLPNSRSQTPSAASVSSGNQGAFHSRTPSFTSKPPSHSSKPLSNSYIHPSTITSSVNMPVNDYGGFHDEDESMERNFIQHHRTTSNSKVMCNV